MKQNFDLPVMLAFIEKAIQPFPKAAMFELFERGYTSIFEQLVACIISIRTFDETTIPVSLRLFEVARKPDELLQLSHEKLSKILFGSSYPEQKAQTMLGIAKIAVEEYDGRLPADFEKLTLLKGVGPKCANLVLGIAAGQAAISVDIHVHRVVNRWGFVQAKQPEKTLKLLEEKVPMNQWVEINRLLMPFGKHICTGNLPKCSTCPILAWCEQIGVTTHR